MIILINLQNLITIMYGLKFFKNTPNNLKTYLGAFVDWDVTSRWGSRGLYYTGCTEQKFYKYLKKQVDRSKAMNSDYIFITAWN